MQHTCTFPCRCFARLKRETSFSLKYNYRVFSLTWPASMQIYWNKRKRLHKKRVQLPQDWFGTPTWQSRSQSIRYFCPADQATNALEESKTVTTKSWFRFNCACVKLSTHLTKRRSQIQGKFSLLAHCCYFLFPKQFFFCDLWWMYLVKKDK